MKTYVATSLTRVEDQRFLADALLQEHQIGLTFDWTRHGTLAGQPKEEVSVKEVQGVVDADFVCVLLPAGRGTHVEMGVALATGKKVFIHAADEAALLGADTYTCVFYHHPLVTRVVGGNTNDLLAVVEEWLEKKGA